MTPQTARSKIDDLRSAAVMEYLMAIAIDYFVVLTTSEDRWRLSLTKRAGGHELSYIGELEDIVARAVSGATPDCITR